MVPFRLDFPDELHRDFKLACVAEGVSMRAKLLELAGEYVKRQEKKKAKK